MRFYILIKNTNSHNFPKVSRRQSLSSRTNCLLPWEDDVSLRDRVQLDVLDAESPEIVEEALLDGGGKGVAEVLDVALWRQGFNFFSNLGDDGF